MKTINAHVTYEAHRGNARHDTFTSAHAMRDAAPGTYPLTVYYESACALCNAEMTNLMLRNTDGLLVFADVSAPGFSDFPGNATMQEMLELIHARTADGRVLKGVPVFELAYRAVGLGWISSAMRLPVLRSVAALGLPGAGTQPPPHTARVGGLGTGRRRAAGCEKVGCIRRPLRRRRFLPHLKSPQKIRHSGAPAWSPQQLTAIAPTPQKSRRPRRGWQTSGLTTTRWRKTTVPGAQA